MSVDGTAMMSAPTKESSTASILAIDLGKFKSVACRFDPATGRHAFETIATNPPSVHDLLVEAAPSLLVIEACSTCGWVADLAESLGIAVRVANTHGEAWRWKRVKRKTDRDDALKLAKLAASDQLPTVHVPEPAVRQHRALIKYRHALIDRRTGIKNTIRSLLDAQGLSMPGRSRGWTIASLNELKALHEPRAARARAAAAAARRSTRPPRRHAARRAEPTPTVHGHALLLPCLATSGVSMDLFLG
jgi:transposase